MKTIFLDLDGTLIDPKEGITGSIQYALEEIGADIPEKDELTWMIGPPLIDSFTILLQDPALAIAALSHYREHFQNEGMYQAEPYDDIGDMFEALRDFGTSLYIATSKPKAYADKISEHFGLDFYTDGLFGSGLDGALQHKEDLLAHALSETETTPENAIMLGDRRFDIEGAHANGIIGIGALWGYAEDGELHLAEADALAGHPNEVPEIIAEFWEGLDD